MSVFTCLQEAVARGRLRDLDLQFARALASLAGDNGAELPLAAALVSRATGAGDVCLALEDLVGDVLFAELGDLAPPVPAVWRSILRASPVVGVPGDDTPLILDDADRLYLGRYWHFEATIAARLRALAEAAVTPPDTAWLRDRLNHYFPAAGDGPDLQKLAAAAALLNRLTVISGGPGTGKTTTVTKLLALLVEAGGLQPPRIVLVAPTGKAAGRLAESIKQARARLACSEAVRSAINGDAATLHRLLGALPGQSDFRHHAGNPLHLDVLVVDEASMVDVPLMARLLDALPAHARLILLGDKDQLASVEAGSVLGDICNRGRIPGFSADFHARLAALGIDVPTVESTSDSPLRDSLVVLSRSYRFGTDSGIGRLARAVNRGDCEAALAACTDPVLADIHWAEVPRAELAERIAALAVSAWRDYLMADDPAAALDGFGRFRFLCAMREGAWGVVEVNRQVEFGLQRAGLIRPGDLYYPGRPLLITRNDYSLRLFNGDIGLVLPDPAAGHRLRAFFPTPEGDLRRILLSRLPAHETVYAMTIHKSQGSEFDRCVVILPDEDAPLLTRELVYTGITRARNAVELWSSREPLARAIARRVERASGLRDALWGDLNADGSADRPNPTPSG